MPTFHLDIVSPDREFFDGDVEEIIFPVSNGYTSDGYMGVLAGHEPMVCPIGIGVLRIKQNGQWRDAAISGGFIEIRPQTVTILSDTVEWPEEIDARRAEAARRRAEERLRQRLSQEEYLRSQAALARALTRLRISNRKV
ncbi:ATP synthase F1 subunit epsilon [Mahella sp.]|uniref:ATP synthase F1 subunit epsilon n=1 Tax=Mahella sp. TaxID=2798721 RepID=UPI0025B862DF|nr:ATP synthase F1 subunit epsilon [Mahella sp.]MBZ4665063.1 synthase subcomplex epsilon subunit [Mahella sp.]